MSLFRTFKGTHREEAAAAAAPATGSARLLLDVPSQRPALGFSRIASAIARIIADSEPRFAVGIFGGWGTGKTTLMQAIEAALADRDVIAVRFSAWRYEREEHVIVPLLDEIREALVAWSDAHGGDPVAKRTAGVLGRVMRSIVAGVSVRVGVPGAMDVSFDANKSLTTAEGIRAEELEARVPRSFYHASFRALERAFSEFVAAGRSGRTTSDRRIVVFVDDLDRCLPENALQVVESMKLFFDLEGFVFVVGLDEDVVEAVIDAKYGREEAARDDGARSRTRVSGSDYIKKVFQLPYRLAPVGVDQVAAFLNAAYDEAGISDDQRRELRDVVEPHLAYLTGRDVNPREIKRYINLYTLQAEINPDLDRSALLALQTTSFRTAWHGVRDALLEFREEYLDLLRRQVAGEATATASGEFEGAPDDFLAYLSEGAPGHALLSVADLEPYASTGEAVRSTRNPVLLEALRALGEARRHLQTVAAGDVDPRPVQRQIVSALTVVEERVATDRSARGRAVAQSAIALKRHVEEAFAAAGTGTRIETALAPVVTESALLSTRLRQLYHAGDPGAPGTALPEPPVAGEAAPDPVAVRNALAEGRRLEQLGDLEAAIAAYRLADDGGDATAAARLGALLAERGSWPEAEAALRRAADRGDGAALHDLAALLARRGQAGEAEDLLRRADARRDPEATYRLGILLRDEDRPEEALDALARAAVAVPRATVPLAQTLLDLGRPGEAVEALRGAGEPSDPDAALLLGEALLARDDLGGAEAAFRRAEDLGSAQAADRLVDVLQRVEERGLDEVERQIEAELAREADEGDERALTKLELLRRRRTQ